MGCWAGAKSLFGKIVDAIKNDVFVKFRVESLTAGKLRRNGVVESRSRARAEGVRGIAENIYCDHGGGCLHNHLQSSGRDSCSRD